MQALHDFAAVGALIGNVVNSDSGLAMVHETSDATGVSFQSSHTYYLETTAQKLIGLKQFFETRCRGDSDEVLTHLKAHV